MKVLHISTWKIPCGIAACTESLVDQLTPLGVESQAYGISPHEIKSMLDEDFKSLVGDIAGRAESFDLIHVQHEFGFFGARSPQSIRNFGRMLKALSKTRRPVLVTFHTDPHFALRLPTSKDAVKQSILNRMWRWHVARQFRGARGCHALVHTAKGRHALVNSGCASDNVSTIPMGHEPRDVRLDPEAKRRAKAKLGLPAKSVLLSMFGFVSPYKGHCVAVEALKQLPKRYRFAVIGGRHPAAGSETTIDTVLQLWKDEDPSRLIITGYADRETIDVYQAATDICLAPYLPSFSLSASAAVTWALTSGRPTVASGIPVFQEINRRGQCLATVAPGAVFELAWMIQKVASDEAMQARLVDAASAYAEANSWAVAARRNLAVYEQALAKRAGAPRPETTVPEPALSATAASQNALGTPKYRLAG